MHVRKRVLAVHEFLSMDFRCETMFRLIKIVCLLSESECSDKDTRNLNFSFHKTDVQLYWTFAGKKTLKDPHNHIHGFSEEIL